MAYFGTQRIQCEYCRCFQALMVRKDRRIVHVPHGNRLPGGAGVSAASNAPPPDRDRLYWAKKVFAEAGIDVSALRLPEEQDGDDAD